MSEFEWCTDCKEYDHKKHCCPRFNKVIRTTLNDSINAVLDEIRAEIETNTEKWWCGKSACFLKQADVLEVIDKYKERASE